MRGFDGVKRTFWNVLIMLYFYSHAHPHAVNTPNLSKRSQYPPLKRDSPLDQGFPYPYLAANFSSYPNQHPCNAGGKTGETVSSVMIIRVVGPPPPGSGIASVGEASGAAWRAD